MDLETQLVSPSVSRQHTDRKVWIENGFIKDRDHRQQIMFMSGWFVRLRKPDGLKKHMTAEPVKKYISIWVSMLKHCGDVATSLCY